MQSMAPLSTLFIPWLKSHVITHFSSPVSTVTTCNFGTNSLDGSDLSELVHKYRLQATASLPSALQYQSLHIFESNAVSRFMAHIHLLCCSCARSACRVISGHDPSLYDVPLVFTENSQPTRCWRYISWRSVRCSACMLLSLVMPRVAVRGHTNTHLNRQPFQKVQ
jgi:hypothetical protein